MNEDDYRDEVIELLSSIDNSLKRLEIPVKEEIDKYLKKKLLTTEARKEMYKYFDGSNSLDEISSKVGKSSEAVRLCAEALREVGFLEYIKDGQTKKPKVIKTF